MTNNQQMLDVLKSLKTKGWKFKHSFINDNGINGIPDYIFSGADEEWITDAMDCFTVKSKEYPSKVYDVPTILEAERVIVKLLKVPQFFVTKQYYNEGGMYLIENYIDICGETKVTEEIIIPFWKEDHDRLLAALQLILKLAEAEPDKFKLIFKEK